MKNVLVVEDDSSCRLMLKTIVERQGHRSVEVANGEEGLRAIQDMIFDLAIVDLFLPELDGLELIQEMKKHAPEIKILAVSGVLGGRFLKPAMILGADVAIPKPIVEEVMVEGIAGLLED